MNGQARPRGLRRYPLCHLYLKGSFPYSKWQVPPNSVFTYDYLESQVKLHSSGMFICWIAQRGTPLICGGTHQYLAPSTAGEIIPYDFSHINFYCDCAQPNHILLVPVPITAFKSNAYHSFFGDYSARPPSNRWRGWRFETAARLLRTLDSNIACTRRPGCGKPWDWRRSTFINIAESVILYRSQRHDCSASAFKSLYGRYRCKWWRLVGCS